MKYTVLPLALMISMFSAAEDGWVAVGQAPTAKPAVKPAVSQQSNRPSPAKPSLQVELLTMVEMMQQEIAELRGTVEEQSHKIELLQKQQQQRYLDLDRRMADLLSTPIAALKSKGDVQSNVLSADDLYTRAMSFIKKKDFTRALEQLDLLAKTYPKHVLAANAFYWSGEVQLAEGNFALAIKQFETVVYQHPDHNKAADSHYKLAVSYDRSGNSAKAKELLKQVIEQYPGISDSAVRLAERYLARLQAK
ncbi:MAG: tol-pal system protein YbgF [Oleispira sp.]|jgi:tol-pal system protein YbgF